MIKSFILLVFLIFVTPLYAFCIDFSISPDVIRRGDAFTITVNNSDDITPRGIVGEQDIFFHRTAPDTYTALAFFGLEQPSGTYRIELYQGNVSKTVEIQVIPRKSRRINLTLPSDKVTLSPENEKRARTELSTMKDKWSRRSGRSWNGKFIPPLNTEVSAEAGVIRIMNGYKKSIHKGVDFKGKKGLPVSAINSGVVVLTQDQFFGGNTVMIDHGEGIFSIYMHLNKILVKEGQKVTKSDVIGRVGSTGRATGPHLHLSVKWYGFTIDPLSLFRLL